jgi:hypothetical protein
MSWGVSASHVPVLVLLSCLFKIKSVLEIGSGPLSTHLFLDRKIYSDLETLVSVETDPEWIAKMKASTAGDNRVKFIEHIPQRLHKYDLVFIDGPQDEKARGAVIKSMLLKRLNGLFVVHDINNPQYSARMNFKLKRYIFKFVVPYTGVFRREVVLPISQFTAAEALIQDKFNKFEEDWTSWKQIMRIYG